MLHKTRTSKDDLEKLLRKAGFKDRDFSVDWSYNFKKEIPYMILNLGNDSIGGTHWTAVDNIRKRYFDPLGASPPSYIPRDYEYSNIQIQDYKFGRCGQYCALFLIYSKEGELDKFYNLFEISNLDS